MHSAGWAHEPYNVAKGLGEDGRPACVLTEVYATPSGRQDHFDQAHGDWEAMDDWRRLLSQCDVSGGDDAVVVHSLW